MANSCTSKGNGNKFYEHTKKLTFPLQQSVKQVVVSFLNSFTCPSLNEGLVISFVTSRVLSIRNMAYQPKFLCSLFATLH